MATGKYGEDAPIEVRAELLRRWQPRAPRAAWEGVPAPLPPDGSGVEAVPGDTALCSEAVERAVAAAQAAGVQHYHLEPGADGKVVIVVDDERS